MLQVKPETVDVSVVGGGLAGIIAAIYAAKQGAKVAVFEKSQELGGRAATRNRKDYRFNLGPHALYRQGHTAKALAELDLPINGAVPSGGYITENRRKYRLPYSLWKLITSAYFDWRSKVQVGRFYKQLPSLDPTPLDHTTVQDWLNTIAPATRAQQYLKTIIRLSTYANAPQIQSAGSVVEQLQMGMAGVYYLDRGWGAMIADLKRAALARGVTFHTATKVTRIAMEQQQVVGIESGEETIRCHNVILALTPKQAATLIQDHVPSLNARIANMVSANAACLEVGLSSLPNPDTYFALGMEDASYFSVHSIWADLAPQKAALLHVAKYLAPNETGEGEVRERLEHVLDCWQPGWRQAQEVTEYLPKMLACSAIDLASEGGRKGRPPVVVDSVTGLFLAGDWVGQEGLIADASSASGKRAGTLAGQRTKQSAKDLSYAG